MDLLNVVIRADTTGADRANAALGKMTAGARQADAALDALGSHSAGGMAKVAQAADAAAAANMRLAASAKGNLNTANIAAQFQDVGVTAAMGMNPMMIALQQGTQLSMALSEAAKTSGGAVKALGGAFLSIASPLSLATIGLVALVAAGLQFVDWGDVAQATLNFLADGLEVIAPYAAAAAVGLALLYSPAILSGMASTVGALGTVAKGVWGVATAIYATVGLPALLIAGLVAIVAGAVIWRDELTKMLGVDIVGAAQDGINWIIGSFVGGFKGIQVLWANLPGVMGDITIQAAQAVVDGITAMLNDSRAQVLQLLSWVSTLPIPGVSQLASAALGMGKEPFVAPKIHNANEGKADAVFGFVAGAVEDAHGVNYLGEVVTFVQDAASGAADALRSLADGIGVDTKAAKAAAKEAERQAKAYRELTRDAHQFVEEQHIEAQALGMTEEAANRLRYEQDMLNKAANDNIKLSSEQRAEISGLATEMAAAEESTRRLTEIYDLGKEVFGGFFADMKSGLKEGQSFWEALGNAGANALDKIADRALSMAADGLFDMIFGAFMGGVGRGGMGGGMKGGLLGGSIIPGILHSGGTAGSDGYSHGRSFSPAIWANAPRYHSGTSFAGLRPNEVPAILERGEKVTPANQNGNSVGGGASVVVIRLADGLQAEIVNEAVGQAVQISKGMVEPVSRTVTQMAQQQRFG